MFKGAFDVLIAILAIVEVVVGLVFYPACLFFVYKIYRVAIGKPESQAAGILADGKDIVAKATRKKPATLKRDAK